MGAVYVAVQRELGRRVALKVPRVDTADEPEVIQNFLREGAIMARLDHPNIVTVYDAGMDDGRPYLVMELIQGEDLNKRIDRAPIPQSTVIAWMQSLASALHYMHEEGIIHRDIKSSNILIKERGNQPLLMDFGISHVNRHSIELLKGRIRGTMRYLSPELLEGGEPGRQSDIYALGMVLYECLTRRLPFDATSQAALIHAILHKPHQPAHEIDPTIPRWLSRVVDTCLKKDPSQRYATASEIVAALEAGRDVDETGPYEAFPRHEAKDTLLLNPDPPAPSRPTWLLGSLLLMAAIVVSAIVFFIARNNQKPLPDPDPPVVPNVTIPHVIAGLLAIQETDSLLSETLRLYRNGSISLSSNANDFVYPDSCFLFVRQGTSSTILSHRLSDGTRRDLKTNAPVVDPASAYPGAEFLYVVAN